MTEQNDLVVVVEQSNLPKPKVDALMAAFAPAFDEARALAKQANDIVVKDENDTTSMLAAREVRLKLQRIRTKIVEPTRKELKEQSLREGRAIDGAANILKALIVPLEEKLEKMEKFAENLAQQRLQEKYQNRVAQLQQYVTDTSLYKLLEMSDAAFTTLLADCKAAHDARIAAEAKAEAERLELEAKQKVFTERRIEMAPYVDSSFNTSILMDMPENEYKSLLGNAKATKLAHDEEQQKIREQARKDRAAKEKAELALKQQREAQAQKEAAERAKLAAEQKAKEDADRQAMLAPDKEKLMALIADLQELQTPAVKSKQASDVLTEFERRMRVVQDWLYEEAKKL